MEKWQKGDIIRYNTRRSVETPKRDVFAGLFLYAGFGMGYYYSKKFEKIWCDEIEARKLAKLELVDFAFVDSFTFYDPVCLAD